MSRLTMALVAVALIAAAAAAEATSSGSQDRNRDLAKVDAKVMRQVATHGRTTFWVVLLMITAVTGSAWLVLGRRLGEDGRMADRVAGAALIVFALLLLRPLIPVLAT